MLTYDETSSDEKLECNKEEFYSLLSMAEQRKQLISSAVTD